MWKASSTPVKVRIVQQRFGARPKAMAESILLLHSTPALAARLVWQVNGPSTIHLSGKARLDVQYIESPGFLVEVTMVGRTAPAAVAGRGTN